MRLERKVKRKLQQAAPKTPACQSTVQVGLPDPDTLPTYKYNSEPEHGNNMVDIVYTDSRPTPRLSDYVVDPADWTASKRGRRVNDPGAPLGSTTVADILSADIDGSQCEICDEVGAECHGEPCITKFHAALARVEAHYMEIRRAAVGFGVFARRAIPKGTMLCEYAGRLMPLDAQVFEPDTSYVFMLGGTARIDSIEYGNISRFVNHHCTAYNLEVVEVMYGRRKVLCYKTQRDIAGGEELFITYGSQYWSDMKPCLCDADEYPHTLNRYHRLERVVGMAPTCLTGLKGKRVTRAAVAAARRRAKVNSSRL